MLGVAAFSQDDLDVLGKVEGLAVGFAAADQDVDLGGIDGLDNPADAGLLLAFFPCFALGEELGQLGDVRRVLGVALLGIIAVVFLVLLAVVLLIFLAVILLVLLAIVLLAVL